MKLPSFMRASEFREMHVPVGSLYLVVLLCVVTYAMLTTPILSGDSDLWYHLSHGRYLAAEGRIAEHSYFSFIDPVREHVNYYWMFGALLYAVQSTTGEAGLILLRWFAYLATLLLVYRYLFRNPQAASRGYLHVLFVLCALVFLGRSMLLRPHTVSYLFIALFIYGFDELTPRKAWILAVASPVWTNMHGIEYPVLVLMSGGFMVELFYTRFRRGTPFTREELRLLLPVSLALLSVYLTPHPIELIKAPFTTNPYIGLYTDELKSFDLQDLFSLLIKPDEIHLSTVSNILFIVLLTAASVSLFGARFRIGHFLMFAGGAYLLSTRIRFLPEFVLLSLPLARALPWISWTGGKGWRHPAVRIALLCVLAALPFVYLNTFFRAMQAYPFGKTYRPAGVARFLARVNTGGRILNLPDIGGYLIWRLYPDYRIYMDFENALLFRDEDYFVVVNAFRDPTVMKRILLRYNPDYIVAPLRSDSFSRLIQNFPDFRPVFFDDTEVLYVNSAVHPDVAAQYELVAVNPYSLTKDSRFTEKGQEGEIFRREIERLYALDPEISLFNVFMANERNIEGRYEESTEYANRVIAAEPCTARGYTLKGVALAGQALYGEAARYFEKALERASERERPRISRNAGFCYLKDGNLRAAYEIMVNGLNPFSDEATFEDIYRMAIAAEGLDRYSEALILYQFALNKVPDGESAWRENIQARIRSYDQPE